MAGCVWKYTHPVVLTFLSTHLDRITVGMWHALADQSQTSNTSRRLDEPLYFSAM